MLQRARSKEKVKQLGNLPPTARANKPKTGGAGFKGRPTLVSPRKPMRLFSKPDVEVTSRHRQPERPGLADCCDQGFLAKHLLDGIDPDRLTLLDQSPPAGGLPFGRVSNYLPYPFAGTKRVVMAGQSLRTCPIEHPGGASVRRSSLRRLCPAFQCRTVSRGVQPGG